MMEPGDLDRAFWRRFGSTVRRYPRGYGLWTWKPYLIAQTLASLSDGEALVYADAGCSLRPEGLPTLMRHLEAARRSAAGWAMFRQPWKIGQHTKRDLLRALDADTEAQRALPMLVGGVLFMVRSAASRALAERWSAWMERTSLIDDTPSPGEHPTFLAHRHDQSVLSLITPRDSVALADDETFSVNWDTRRGVPVQARRWRHRLPWPTSWLERPLLASLLLRL
jgi:hypothetical protein